VVGWVLAILVGMAGLLPQSAQTPKTASFLPSVSISLPPDILSETVQISSFLVGPFGGYGGYAAQRTGVHAYEIPIMVDGKAATEIRMIVYASGCEIQQFVILCCAKIPLSFEVDRYNGQPANNRLTLYIFTTSSRKSAFGMGCRFCR
jgi:hypothetical protein